MDFADYITNYPDQEDPEIQKKTTVREEFYELKGSAKESVPKQGEFFNHQNLFARYLMVYDRIFNIHETGTGKTGSIINAAEMFKDNKIVKKVIIVQPGEATLEDFTSQILKFFPDRYGDENPKVARKNIKRWYDLQSYQAFANKLEKMSNESINDAYSDTLIFFDESHRLRNYVEQENENIYNHLWRLTHQAKRIKVVVASATPLVNSVNDFVPLVNLLLDSDKQVPTNWDYSKVSIRQLEPLLRGKITFVRGLETGVSSTLTGTKIKLRHVVQEPNGDQVIPTISRVVNQEGKLITVSSEPIQGPVNTENKEKTIKDVYLFTPMAGRNGNLTRQGRSYQESFNQPGSFRQNEREASTFVYPNGTWGTEGSTLISKKTGNLESIDSKNLQ